MRAVAATAELLAGLGHDVAEVDPHYPEATAPFLVQYFGAIRREWELAGRTSGNSIVNFPGADAQIGKLLDVTITGHGPNSFRGEVAHAR